MKYCSILIFILLWFITLVNCDKVCDVQTRGKKKCCAHYKYVNGKCVECPKGWYGDECRLPCPDEYYGVFCTKTCNCAADQICDVQEGCVHNKIVECPKGLFGEECKLPCPNGYYGLACKETCNCTANQICNVQEGCVNNSTDKFPRDSFRGGCQCPTGRYGVTCNETCNCTAEQICNAEKGCVCNNTDNTLTRMETTSTEKQTTQSNGYHEGILSKYLYVVPSGGVILVLVILLVHTHRKKKTSEDGLRHDQQDQASGSQAVQLSQNAVLSDYAEISEVNTTYSHTITFSSDYNELSFSRSRWDRSELNPTANHYDTSKKCLLKIKESKSESKPDVGGNPYSLAKSLMDTGNEVQEAQISEGKEGNVE